MSNKNYVVNKVYTDDFGRSSGIFIAYKPAGVSSHDIVYKFRRYLKTKKVGHAGALDLYAKGILVILVGSATKLSEKFLDEDKEYKITVLFGMSTDSGDIEGKLSKIQSQKSDIKSQKSKIEHILKTFQPEYNQFVPVFSSVKIGGRKLREMARSCESFEVIYDAKTHTKVVDFTKKDGTAFRIDLPSKLVKIYKIELLELFKIQYLDLIKILNKKEEKVKESDLNDSQKTFQAARILVRCSKGTYVRQLAIDIGEKLGIAAMVIDLERTSVGEFGEENIYNIDS